MFLEVHLLLLRVVFAAAILTGFVRSSFAPPRPFNEAFFAFFITVLPPPLQARLRPP